MSPPFPFPTGPVSLLLPAGCFGQGLLLSQLPDDLRPHPGPVQAAGGLSVPRARARGIKEIVFLCICRAHVGSSVPLRRTPEPLLEMHTHVFSIWGPLLKSADGDEAGSSRAEHEGCVHAAPRDHGPADPASAALLAVDPDRCLCDGGLRGKDTSRSTRCHARQPADHLIPLPFRACEWPRGFFCFAVTIFLQGGVAK